MESTKEDKLHSLKFSLQRTKEMLARSINRWRGKKIPSDIAGERKGMRQRIEKLKQLISEQEG